MKLFISYAHVDKHLVRELVEVLQTAGYESWFDHHLVAGQEWETQLYTAIQQSDAFLYALTPESATSEWCLWEWKQAVNLGKPIIPVLLQARTKPPAGLDQIQYVDLSEGVTGTAVARLTRALNTAQIMNREVLPTIPDHPQGRPAQALHTSQTMPIFIPRSRRYWGLGIVMVIILMGLVGVLAWQTMQGDLPSPTLEGLVVTYIPTATHTLSYTHIATSPSIVTLTASQYFEAGLMNSDLGAYEHALVDYSRAIELDPEYVDAYNNRGVIYRKLGKYEQALADFNRAIELDPEYAFAYNNIGFAYFNLKGYEQALTNLDRAIELDPDFALAYHNRGLVYGELEDYEQALVNYSRAIELDPEYVDAYNNLGVSYHILGEYEQAITHFDRAIELDPDFANPYWGLGDVYYDQERWEEALVAYQRYLELVEEDAHPHVIDRVAELEGRLAP